MKDNLALCLYVWSVGRGPELKFGFFNEAVCQLRLNNNLAVKYTSPFVSLS